MGLRRDQAQHGRKATGPTRREVLKAGLGAAGMLGVGPLIFACGGSTRTSVSSSAASALPKYSKISMLIDTSGAGNAWQGGIKLFNQRNSGKIELVFDTVDFSSLLQKESLLFFSKSTQYDVFPVNGEWTAAVQNFLLPLDSFIEADGLDVTKLFGKDAVFKAGGKVLGLPGRNAPNIFAYRKDLYANLGLTVPTTLDEWSSQVPKLTKKGADGRTLVYGTSISEGASAAHFSMIMFAYLGFPIGMRVLTDDLKQPDPSLKSETGIHVLTVIQEMAAYAPNLLAWSFTDNINGWQQGSIASDNFFGARSQAIEDPKTSKVVGKVGYALAPGQPASTKKLSGLGPHTPIYVGGPWYITINGKTSNPRAAWELVKFLAASDEGQKGMALNYSNQPTLLSVLNSPEYQAKDPAAATASKIYQQVGWSTIAPVPKNADVELAVHKQIQLLLGGANPKTVAQGIYNDVGAVLKG
jgi:ABC-type glycerol-3-phosphate transport system substrate-binding protein